MSENNIKINPRPLNSLSDVVITSAAQYDHLEFDGTDWVDVTTLTQNGDIIPDTTGTHNVGTDAKIFSGARFNTVGVLNLDGAGAGAKTLSTTAGGIVGGQLSTSSTGTATIESVGTIAGMAFGQAKSTGAGNATISNGGAGSFALGVAVTTTADNSIIRTTDDSAMALGSAIQGGEIWASGAGSFAHGIANGAGVLISATQDGSVQFAPGTNAIANSVQIGDAQNAGKEGVLIRATGQISSVSRSVTGTNTFNHTNGFAALTMNAALNRTNTFTGSGTGSFTNAFMNSPNTAGANTAINTTGTGAFLNGYLLGGTTGSKTATMTAYGAGTFVNGFAQSNANNALITATGTGSTAIGWAQGGTIESTNIGSFAGGSCGSSSAGTKISSTGPGTFAFGQAQGGRTIAAEGAGSLALGFVVGGNISANGYGNFAMGWVGTGGSILANRATPAGSGGGGGSMAFGWAVSNAISAPGRGCLAFGDSTNGTIVAGSATAFNCWQFGPGTNITAQSLQVGSGTQLTDGGVRLKIRTVTSGDATVATTDHTVLMNMADGTSRVANLPAVATTGVGFIINIKKIDATAAQASVTPNGTELIEGVNAAKVISSQFDNIMLQSDGSAGWWVL